METMRKQNNALIHTPSRNKQARKDAIFSSLTALFFRIKLQELATGTSSVCITIEAEVSLQFLNNFY